MSDLLKINVNDHTEKKGQLTYLSWAWAWAEVLKFDPGATWVAHQYGPPGAEQPCMWIGDTAIVHCSVTIKGQRRECLLPVMDHKNNAVKQPDARKISDAIMRCMTKAIAMHGLGLYIYAGEDLPQGDEPEAKPDPLKNATPIKATAGCWDRVPPDDHAYLKELAAEISVMSPADAVDRIALEDLDNDQKVCVWDRLPSAFRTAFKREQEQRHMKAAIAKQQKEAA